MGKVSLELLEKNGSQMREKTVKLKILVIARCGIGGHRGRKFNESQVRESLLWTGPEADVA